MKQKQGMIAILDALGAARYGDVEIATFLESRQRVLNILHEKAHIKETRGEIERSAVTTFTFNDTVLIVFRTQANPTLEDAEHFGLLLRKFAVDSLAKGILFRGSIAVGKFYVDEASNTVMGAAVNWPKGFYVSGVRPQRNGEDPRAKCLTLLSNHGVPKGAERKHLNTMAFFDHCVVNWNKEHRKRKS